MVFFVAAPDFLGADIAHQFLIPSPKTLQKAVSLQLELRMGLCPAACSSVSSFSFLMTLKCSLVLIVVTICFQIV